MTAITVRLKSDNSLVCFGPDNGMYDPGFNSITMKKQVESDYAAVMQEWVASKPTPPDRQAQVLANPAVPQWFKDYLG